MLDSIKDTGVSVLPISEHQIREALIHNCGICVERIPDRIAADVAQKLALVVARKLSIDDAFKPLEVTGASRERVIYCLEGLLLRDGLI
jgi:hypothetical protein